MKKGNICYFTFNIYYTKHKKDAYKSRRKQYQSGKMKRTVNSQNYKLLS